MTLQTFEANAAVADPHTDAHRLRALQKDLIDAETASLRRRIAQAGEQADRLKLEIQRAAQQLTVRRRGQGPLTVQLLAWPVLLQTQGSAVVEPQLCLDPRSPIYRRLCDLWRASIEGQADLVDLVPCLQAHNLADLIGRGPAPNRVFESVMRFGHRFMLGEREAHGPAVFSGTSYPLRGAHASVQVMLAFAVCRASSAAPRWRVTQAMLCRASEMFGAMFQEPARRLIAEALSPSCFFDAIEAGHARLLGHFATWCERRGLDWDLELVDTSMDGQRQMRLMMRHATAQGGSIQLIQEFDGCWRTSRQLHALVPAARRQAAAARLSMGCGDRGDWPLPQLH